MRYPVIFGSIAINESRFIADSIAQHGDLCQRWFIAEGADRRYQMATSDGLSIDTQATDVRRARGNDRVTYTQRGWCEDKSELRNVYADAINRYLEAIFAKMAIVVVIDIDEFLCRADLAAIVRHMQAVENPTPAAISIPHIHFWRDGMKVITGKYWDVPHDRIYFWPVGARYGENHNHPVDPTTGKLLQKIKHERHGRKFVDRRAYLNDPEQLAEGKSIESAAWYHFGSARDAREIDAKNKYYIARGEKTTRPETTESRAAFFTEKQTGILPDGCRTWDWLGPWPECCLANRERYGIAPVGRYRELKMNRTDADRLW